jgi:hypothetical protein
MPDGLGARSDDGASRVNRTVNAALTKYFPKLPAVKGWRDIVIVMSNELRWSMRDSSSPHKLEETSHGQHF